MRTFCLSVSLILFLSPLFSYGQSCNNWLKLNSQPSFVRVGDLDITGDKITVEAIFNRTAPWSGTDHFQGDLVSKHEGPYDCNYLLRPGSAEIATTTGYYKTPPICEIELNKTYHVAMVYDGSSLKFYRNGFLMSQVAARGNLIQNNWPTQIGFYYLQLYSTNLIGYINEVRIWNIAKSQFEIQTYMKQSLPSPNTISGLMAYYTFDNLLNKQGNATWNGTLNGNASINETNPNCNIIVDSCTIICPTLNSIDFEFQQSICSPKTVLFNTQITGVESFLWSFGDGQTNNQSLSPEITFLNYGNYNVQLEVKFSSTCSRLIKKNIPINYLFDDDILLNVDTSLCYGDSVLIKTSVNNINFCWQTLNGEPAPLSLSGYLKPKVTTTYYLNIQNMGYDSLTINVREQPFVKTINDTSICSGEKIFIQTTGEDNFYWTPSTGLSSIDIANPVAMPTVTTKYFVSVTNNEGCTAKDSVIITVNENPLPLLGTDKFMCSGDSLKLDAGNPGAAFEWQNLSNQQIFITKGSGLHKVKITKNSCSIFDSVYIYFNPIPIISLISDTSICKGKSVPLSINSVSNYSYQWFPTNGLSDPSIKNPIATIIDTIKYEVTATSDLGCKAKKSITINALKIPIVELGNDTTLCPSGTLIFNAQNTGAYYLWNDGSTEQINKISSPGVYYVSVTKDGCTSSDSIIISLKSKPEFALSPDVSAICVNEKLTLKSKGGEIYQWFKNGQKLIETDSIIHVFPDVSAKYSVIIKEIQCGYSDTLFSEVFIKPLPQIQISKSNDVTCEKPQSQLYASGGHEYNWSPSMNINNTAISNPIVRPSIDTWYTVTVKGENGCSAKDSINISSNFSDGSKFYIPNAFTPNNDGKNDCFGVTYWTVVDFFELSIFNRWGEKVFFTRKNECWNGYYKGVLQPEGIYVYLINAKGSCGSINKKGTFTLLK